MTGTPPPGPPRPRAFRLTPEPAPEPGPAPEPDREPEPAFARPRAFRTEGSAPRPDVVIAEQPDPYAAEAAALVEAGGPAGGEAAIEAAQRRGMLGLGGLSWAGLFWSALGGLLSLGVGLWVTRLIDDLFARVPALGWAGLALLGVAGLALLAMAIREAIGIGRQRRVATLHKALAEARDADDGRAARKLLPELLALYAKRGSLAPPCAEVRRASGEIIDGRDLVDLAELRLMTPLDRLARREIAAAAKRVSLVTAVSPRAFLDLFFVVGQIVVLIRTLAGIYSGRPGLLGFLRLARSVSAHLAITGGMAVGDSLLQQVLGHGLAAKLSARLGEGVLNGILTTRVGLSAMAVCRPLPFNALPPPTVRDVAPFLLGDGKG